MLLVILFDLLPFDPACLPIEDIKTVTPEPTAPKPKHLPINASNPLQSLKSAFNDSGLSLVITPGSAGSPVKIGIAYDFTGNESKTF